MGISLEHRKTSLLFVNRSFWPECEATGQLLTELCADLAVAGFHVDVICGPVRGEVSNVASEPPVGVTIHRVPCTNFPKSSFIGRLTNMITFPLVASWRAMRLPRPDVVVVETDPPFLCLLGAFLTRWRRTRLVCYLQDIYPEVAIALQQIREGWMTSLLRRCFFNAYRNANLVLVLSQDMRRLLVENGLKAENVQVIPNWIDVQSVRPIKNENAFRQEHQLDDKFIVMYSGNMGLSQNLTDLVRIAESLNEYRNILFAFVGDGADRVNLEKLVSQKSLENVQFFDYQPKSELATSLSAADLHVVILRSSIKQFLMPSKIYGVLASGTPALVLSAEDCELAEIVTSHDVGTVIAETAADGSHEAFITKASDAIVRLSQDSALLNRQGTNARAYAVEHCSREKRTTEFARHIRSILVDDVPSDASSSDPMRELIDQV